MAEAVSTSRRRAKLWPGLLIALLVVHASLCVVVVVIASTDKSAAIEPGYYDKAIAWDEQAALRQTPESVGWRVELAVGEASGPLGVREIVVGLFDLDGGPVGDASIVIEAFRHANSGDRQRVVLLPQPDGRYLGQVNARRGGLWEFRGTIRRDSRSCGFARTVEFEAGG